MTQPLVTTYQKLIAALLIFIASHANALTEGSSLLAATSNADEFLPVEQAYVATLITIDDTTVIDWQIAPNYYLYQHAFEIKADNQTLTPTYSNTGIERTDEYFGDVTVYYNSIQQTINATTQLSIRSQGCADAGLCYPPRTQHFTYNAAADNWQEVAEPQVLPPAETNQATPKFFSLILLAFVGGLILNLMPCVLPVLTLKAISFANAENRQQRIIEGWSYTAGVVISFVAVAALLIIIKASGAAVGWGFQLQSPFVVAALVYLFFLLGLSLIGALELNGPVLNFNSNSGGAWNSFTTGVLACVVASPCTAPFMGTAIGTALTLPTLPALSIFVSLGVGMAAPFLALSYIPSVARLIPKPGAWMNTLKEALAFPLFATCIWLITVAAQQSGGAGVATILSGCTIIAFVAWWRKTIGLVIAFLLIIVTSAASAYLSNNNKPQNSARFELNSLDTIIKENDSVFVNVTASWCITCKANERILFKDTVQASFTDSDTIYIEADWTRPNADIAALLERHNRNGIPLYLLYTNGNIARPYVFPQLLTETSITNILKP